MLRDLALTPADVRGRYLAPVPKLMSRTFAEEEVACVKATSFASEIAPELVPPGERALFLFARPDHYIPSILAGENSLKEMQALAASRASRLQSRGTELPAPRSGHSPAPVLSRHARCKAAPHADAAPRLSGRFAAMTAAAERARVAAAGMGAPTSATGS